MPNIQFRILDVPTPCAKMRRQMAHPQSTKFGGGPRPESCLRPSLRLPLFVCFHGLRRHGKAHDKSGPNAVRIVPRRNLSRMCANNAITNAEAEPCAFAYFLSGEKGIEDAIGMRNARPVIAEYNFQAPVVMRCCDFNFSLAPRLIHRVVSVVQYIQKSLLQLVRI